MNCAYYHSATKPYSNFVMAESLCYYQNQNEFEFQKKSTMKKNFKNTLAKKHLSYIYLLQFTKYIYYYQQICQKTPFNETFIFSLSFINLSKQVQLQFRFVSLATLFKSKLA
ncbi:unnamed protein product [Paramecium octaurelia]|uniref:Uncharacterized protein n=1 Tax=Paramecium octaurelia TaxID=43137 RepID=A0A8S1W5Z8_PAROT|nr:unnamed protein product [Paramecium octaurelia]